MQTANDVEIVRWIGRVGAASAEHVMARFGMGRSWAYARLRVLTRDRLLERKTLLHQTPGLYIATREGLRWTGQERFGVARLSPGSFMHSWELTSAVVGLQARLPESQLLAERELRVRERESGELVASVRLGEPTAGRPPLHRPDMALIGPDSRVSAVEVELSIKAAPRLRAICRGWGRARHVAHVYYLAPPEVARAVLRAVSAVRAQELVTVCALRDLDGLAQVVRRGANRAES
jgi:hypothetical protein